MKPKLTLSRSGSELKERLQKVLAQSGLGSRRSLEERILRGEILVNGQAANLGQTVVAGDRVVIDGRAFVVRRQEGDYGRVILYNKPEGEITTRHDPQGRRTVFDRLPRVPGQRWISIGRLDINSGGLLVFTTNGALADRFLHPSQGFEREYLVRVHGEADEARLAQLLEGVQLDDGPARLATLEALTDEETDASNRWYRVVIDEGRNREVRRMFAAIGLEVSRLKRVRFGPFALSKALHRGEFGELAREEVDALCREAGLPVPGAILIAVDPRLRRTREAADGEGEAPRRPRRYEVAGEEVRDPLQRRLRHEAVLGDFGRERPDERPARGRPGRRRGRPGRPDSGGRPPSAPGAQGRGRAPGRPMPGRPGPGGHPGAGRPGSKPPRRGGPGAGSGKPGRGPGGPGPGPGRRPERPRFPSDSVRRETTEAMRFPSEVQQAQNFAGGYSDPPRGKRRRRGGPGFEPGMPRDVERKPVGLPGMHDDDEG